MGKGEEGKRFELWECRMTAPHPAPHTVTPHRLIFMFSDHWTCRFLEQPLPLVSFLRSSLLNIRKIRNFCRSLKFPPFLERKAPGYISSMKAFYYLRLRRPTSNSANQRSCNHLHLTLSGRCPTLQEFFIPSHSDGCLPGIPFPGNRKILSKVLRPRPLSYSWTVCLFSTLHAALPSIQSPTSSYNLP